MTRGERDGAAYSDRRQAAERLAALLEKYRGTDALVLAIPRGGVVVGAVVAERLGLEFDVILTKKLGHPLQPEFAIGVVDLEAADVDQEVVEREGIGRDYIEKEIARLREELRRRHALYKGNARPPDLSGRAVILADDGVATGRTIFAAIRLARAEGARRVVVAVPVAPPEAAAALARAADELVCPLRPAEFFAIGQFYDSFEQVEDAEAVALLKRAHPASAR